MRSKKETVTQLSEKKKKILDTLYLTPESAASFSTPGKLLKEVNKSHSDSGITLKDITFYLSDHSSYYLHRPVKTHFKRSRYIAYSSNEILAVDLMDLPHLVKDNDGYRYVLVCIDVFSRKAFAVSMKNKKCVNSVDAFKKVFKKTHYRSVFADMGGEFKCKELVQYLKSEKCYIYYATNYVKVGIVERFIRTIRLKLERYLEAKQTRRYIDVLGDLILSYNKTYHRSIGTSPLSVNSSNRDEIFQYQYMSFKKKGKLSKKKKIRSRIFKYDLGSYVRVSNIKRHPYSKETRRERWTEEVFKIVDRRMRESVPIYILEDTQEEKVTGTWYEQELFQATFDPDGEYKLDPDFNIKTRKVKGRKQFYVKYQGWPSKFNEWIDEGQMNDLK